MDSSNKIEMTVKFHVTVPQALALEAMFNHWSKLGSWGASRNVGFYVDGDGNFQPQCYITYSESIPGLTEELRQAAMGGPDVDELSDNVVFDFDAIAWRLRDGD